MKHKVKHSKRVIGAPNTNKDRVIGEANTAKERVMGHPNTLNYFLILIYIYIWSKYVRN